MNSIQINDIFKKHKYTRSIYKGTIAFNERPKKISRPSAYIINTQNRGKDGEHWLALYFNLNGDVDFFDSYGLGPTFYGLEKYLLNTSNKCNYNTKALQGLDSHYCGLYCALFILFKCQKKSFLNFLNNFSYDSFENDKEIEKMIINFN